MEEKEYKSQKDEYEYYAPWNCTSKEEEVDHWKERPVCHDVTKQNCVTKWEIKDDGTKVG